MNIVEMVEKIESDKAMEEATKMNKVFDYISNIPENSKINKLGIRCYTLMWSELAFADNWTAEYYDSHTVKVILQREFQRVTSWNTFAKILNTLIEEGKVIDKYLFLQRIVPVNPEIIEYFKGINSD